MWKMLIVDDEDMVLDGLKTAVDWKKLDIEIVGEATDGKEALDFINNHSIDILLTDIKMPIMDGIILIEKVRAAGYGFKIVMLTGYEDFNYARKSIQNKVYEYLLKPLSIEKLEEVMTRLVMDCSLEQKKNDYEIELENKLKELTPQIEERFYLNLLNGYYQQDIQMFLNMDIVADKYKIVIIHLDNLNMLEKDGHPLSQKDKQLINLKVSETLSYSLKENFKVAIIQYSTSDIVVLFKLNKYDDSADLTNSLKEIQEKIMARDEFTVSIGLGRSYENIEEIHKSFQEAEEAIKHKLYYGNGCIVSSSDIKINQGSYIDYFIDMKKQLVDAINLKKVTLAEEMLARIQSAFESSSRYSIEYARKLSMELILILSLTLYDKNEQLEKIYVKQGDLLAYIQNMETIADIFSALKDVYRDVIDYLNQKGEIKNKKTIEYIVEYIRGNLGNEISLEDISRKVYLTPNYIGHIFKETMNINFSEYIFKCRMEQAEILLKEPGCKIYEVAYKVGYKNPHYFSRLFREYTGFNPSEFKN